MFKKTKSALALGILAIVLCMGMLVGTTYAWFTDSVSSANNIISAGNLDVALEYKTNWSDDWAPVDENTKLFKEGALYEPGYTEIVYLRVSNEGSLALKYLLSFNITNEKSSVNVYGEEFRLSDYLQIGTYVQDEYSSGFNYADILMPSMFGNRESALKNVKLNTLSMADAKIVDNAPILPGEKTAQVLAIVLTLPETVGNEANAKDKDNAPSIDFGIELLATQFVHEEDSFGPDYDKDAVYYDALVTTDAEFVEAINDANVKYIAIDGDVTYDWGGDSYENSKALLMKGKVIFGLDEEASITFKGYGSANPITDVTLKNIAVYDETVGDNESSWEHGYLEFVSLTAENVEFKDSIMLDGNNVLTNCTLNNQTASWYGLWIEGGNTVLKDCEFTGTRAVKIHEAYGTNVDSVVIKDCYFKCSEKPGVVIGDLDATTSVSIENCVFDQCQAGDQGLFIYETDTNVDSFEFAESNNEVK